MDCLAAISRLENYHDNPAMDSLLRVADVLQINLGEALKRAIQSVDKKGRAKRIKNALGCSWDDLMEK